MSENAKDILKKFASELDVGKPNSFVPMDYPGCSDLVLRELEYKGYITLVNEILGSVELTRAGYDEAKK